MGKSLKAITGERKKKEVRFATCDIEVDNWTKFVCIGFYDGFTDTYAWFDDMAKFLDFCFDHCQKNNIESVFAHFGGKFDFNFIIQAIVKSRKYGIGSMIPRSSSILCFDMLEGKFSKKKKRKKVAFRDSSALLPFALRTLTETFDVDVKKGEIEYEKIGELWKTKKGRQEVLDYLKDDCVSLWLVLDKFYNSELVQKAGPSFTTASQALKVYQTFMPKDLVIKSLPDEADEFIRDAYFGGRTEVFKPVFDSEYDIKNNPRNFSKKVLKELQKQKKYKKLFYLDVNSLFPFAMSVDENKFPVASLGFVYDKDFYNPDDLGFWDITVEVPKNMFCPPLGVKYTVNGSEKFIFPTGKFRGKWSIAEIEYAKSIGVKVLEYHKGIKLVSGGNIFKDYILTLYNKRLEARKAGDSASAMLLKLMMNSTYGKFGQQMKDKENLVIDEGQEGVAFHSEIPIDKNVKIRFGTQKKDMSHGFSNVAIAAYVTAYSRIHMHKIYMDAGEEHLYYTDTDSIFSTKNFETGDKLGELKLEYTCKSACFLLPKTYVNEGVEGESFDKKLTMKGFDKKKIQHFTFDDFTECLYGDMKRLSVVQTPKFATLKTALRKGEMVCMAFDPSTEEKRAERKLDDLNCELMRLQLDSVKEMMPKEAWKEEVKSVRAKIRQTEKKLSQGFEASVRGIKSRYDKRICSSDGFFSKPIHIQ